MMERLSEFFLFNGVISVSLHKNGIFLFSSHMISEAIFKILYW